MTDVPDDPWTLTYDGTHHLRLVEDSSGLDTLHTEYDAQGRAYRQYDPSGTLILEVTYLADGTTLAIDALGSETTDEYDGRKTMVHRTDDQSGAQATSYDGNFRPTKLTDENGIPVKMSWSADGANLLRLTDGENGVTDLTYDSYNNLTEATDAREHLTTYTYNIDDPDPARRTLLLEVEDAVGGTTIFIYATAADASAASGAAQERH